MPWWAWLIVGGVLAGIELTAADLAFYFIFLGASAGVVGLVQLAGGDLAMWEQWLLFAALSLASMVLFRQRLYARLRGRLVGFDGTPTGEVVRVIEDMAVGEKTRVDLRGSQWTATNVGTGPIASGAAARVVGIRGAGLSIEGLPAGESASDNEAESERNLD